MKLTIRTRLILLFTSLLLMAALIAWNASLSAEQNLPPTPTEDPVWIANQPSSPTAQNMPPTATLTATLPPTVTPVPTRDPAAVTATADAQVIATGEAALAQATQNARAMRNIVRGLYEDGAITELDGSYKKLDDFTISFNRSGYYQMNDSGQNAERFVLRTNMLWDNAGEQVSYPTAGCGVIFAYRSIDNHYRVFLNLDGNVRLHRMQGGEFSLVAIDYFGPLQQPAGHANLILSVDQGWISVYIDHQAVTRFQDEEISPGRLYYAIAAGSSTDYGTRCDFVDTELWVFE